jgi:hypothetical protein
MDVDSRDETEGMSAAQRGDSDDDELVQKAKSGTGGKKGLSDIEDEEGSGREETGGAGSKVSYQAVREGPICKPVIPAKLCRVMLELFSIMLYAYGYRVYSSVYLIE